GTDGDDTEIQNKHLYGEWDFGAAKLLVGKTYDGIQQFMSAQMYAGDSGLLGNGLMYGGRPYQIALSFGGFRIALADPKATHTPGVTVVGVTVIPGTTTGDIDQKFPKIVARYGMSFDQFSFDVMGGYQHYEIEDVVSLVDGTTNDIDVNSWVIGGDATVNFGPAYVKGGISYAENGGNARWAAGAGIWDLDDDIIDMNTLQFAVVAGFKMSDQITFEAGFGYRNDDLDISGAEDDTTLAYYGNASIALAPGVWIIPEIGYYDYQDGLFDEDQGNAFYGGAKWQIDF
ncbi:MAG: hypothetical protein JSV31_32120, partial [Desulfobacterales bacterium]